MRILISNDDGISAPGIVKLAAVAKRYGDVTVAAPKTQCSGMSQSITIEKNIRIDKVAFPVDGVDAYSIDGTPADCVRTAIGYIMKDKPDMFFSGINMGYNIGSDIAYSGTIGAAAEALIAGVPSIAFSRNRFGTDDVLDRYIGKVIDELLKKEKNANEIWNVNFPACEPSEFRGILWDRKIAQRTGYCFGCFSRDESKEGIQIAQPVVKDHELREQKISDSSDLYAVLNGFISIGKVKVGILADN